MSKCTEGNCCKDRNDLFYKLAVIGGILVLLCIAAAAVKHIWKNRCEADDDWDMDFECDENGCYYADEDEFEDDEE